MSRTEKRRGRKAYRRLKLIMRPGETRHHRHPKSLGGSNDVKNISIVKRDLHECWHQLFSNHTPETIAAIINEKWIPKHVKFVVTYDYSKKS